MYGLLSKVTEPFIDLFSTLVNSFSEYPMAVALFLGLIGAFAPCQLTGNFSAITFYGNRTVQLRTDWIEIFSFIMGKVVVFSLLGLFVWGFGQSFETKIIEYFPILRKLVGPLIIFVGLVLLGLFKLRFLNRITARIPTPMRTGKLGSFLMGVSFSIAFCPTMFVIFFLTLMPVVLTTSYGFVLPAVFGIATSLPLLIIFFVMWFLELDQHVMKRSRKVGNFIQKLAGTLLIVIGILDTITYWAS